MTGELVSSPTPTTPTVDFEALCRQLGLEQPWDASDPNIRALTEDSQGVWQGWHHQLYARWRIMRRKRIILSMDKGLGKTSVILSIFEDPNVHKNIPGFTVIILCPEKGMGSFIRDLKKFPGETQNKFQVVLGQAASRERQWKNHKATYFICTYATFLADTGRRLLNKSKVEQGKELPRHSTMIAPTWAVDASVDAVVCDEFHRQFRSYKSAAFKLFASIFKDVEYFIPMSGSAVDEGPEDLWPALHLVDRKLWSSYWKYCYTWCDVQDTHFGKRVKGPNPSRVKLWRAAVAQDVIHITAEMVKGMPGKQRDFLDVEMQPWQKKLHNDLRDRMYHETPDGDFLFADNPLTTINMLRQALICPKVLSQEYGYGQGIEDIWDDAFEGGIHQYALFTPFKAPIPHLKQYLESKGARVWVLQGSIGLQEQEKRLSEWRASLDKATAEHPSILMSTILYAESWEIPEARYAYLLGYEWSPEQNKQAEDRLRRLISVGITYIRYVRHLGAYDEDLITILVEKAANVRLMYNNWYKLKDLLKPV